MTFASTIPEALVATAEREVGEYVFHLEDDIVRISCAELGERALRGARRLMALGVQPGEAVGVLGANRPEWVISAFAIWTAGAVLVPMQVPIRIRNREAFSESLRRVFRAARGRIVLVEPRLAPLSPAEVTVPWNEGGGESVDEPPEPDPESAAVIQFTSGSTASPRGALVTHSAVMAQMEVLDELLRDGHRLRSSLSWTPFFHDLGLFLNVLPAAIWGLTSHHLPTDRFARDPAEWLRLIARTETAVTITPAGAFGRAIKSVEDRHEQVDLGSLEVVRFAAEGIDPQVIQQAMAATERRLGLQPAVLGSSYGLAEAVLAVCYSRPGSGLVLDRISLDDLVSGGEMATPAEAEPSRLLAGCGQPKMDLRIVGATGDLPERRVGEIWLRGPSLMSRYIGSDAVDPFVEGWLPTGDLGYVADGELYVTGRVKDLVIVMGHNYYPEDFEWAANRVPGVRPGRCVAFNPPGTEDVVVLAEVMDGAPKGIEGEIADQIADIVGIRPSDVLTLPAGTVQKTTSGKLRRAAMREAYAADRLKDLAPQGSMS